MDRISLLQSLVFQLRVLVGGDVARDLLAEMGDLSLVDRINAVADQIRWAAPVGWELYFDESTIYWERHA